LNPQPVGATGVTVQLVLLQLALRCVPSEHS
jgi:hypothetical protein